MITDSEIATVTEKELKDAAYIVWVDHGMSGWCPYVCNTPEEAIEFPSYTLRKVITRPPIRLVEAVE